MKRYDLDGDGNIDFASPAKWLKWSNPVKGPVINLEANSNKKGRGISKNGTLIDIAKGSRPQHFSIANRICKISQTGSPDGWTWHHLLSKYKMVLVDRVAHAKHGHNGGKHFW